MPTRDVTPGEWGPFFEEFSRRHRTWLVDLQAFGAELGAQSEVRQLPLKDISVDHEPAGGADIAIELGDERRTPLVHVLRGVTHVRVKESPGGADEALEVESRDGSTTLLVFRESPLPELVDGVVSEA